MDLRPDIYQILGIASAPRAFRDSLDGLGELDFKLFDLHMAQKSQLKVSCRGGKSGLFSPSGLGFLFLDHNVDLLLTAVLYDLVL